MKMSDDTRASATNKEGETTAEPKIKTAVQRTENPTSEPTVSPKPEVSSPGRTVLSNASSMRPPMRFTQSLTFRMIIVCVLILLMLIPLALVTSIVDERSSSYQSVLTDISSHWGQEQILAGPVLVMPYTEIYRYVERVTDDKGRVTELQKERTEERRAVLLPKQIHLEGAISPEYRFRGLYQSLVYSESLTLTGTFEGIESAVRSLGTEGWEVQTHWDKAFVVVGLTDTKGIAKISAFQLNDKKVNFSPGTRMNTLLQSGFHASLVGVTPSQNANFSLQMDIKGSTGFRMAPLGELSEMHLTSPWAHPSFYGEILPSTRSVTEGGFDATWSIPHLVRSYPQYWIDGQDAPQGLAGFSVGVSLFEPVTLYTESTRAAKYGILFIALTFLTLALLEIITKSRPSMVQYAMIGAALTLFYVLLIALAEHIGFNKAYMVATAVVISLNTFYCLFVLSRKALAFIITAVLSALYAVLFMTLRAEDYALLTGSILLAVAVAVTMFFTRNLHKAGNDYSE
jgi:inner membrane protein